jgi:DDE_Tnp_1-associated
MAIERLMGHFVVVVDPHRHKVEHPLTDILVIAVCAMSACAESWNDIALYGRSKLSWLRIFLELPNDIPSHDTFRRVFMLIDLAAFEACFPAWAASLAGGFEREVVAIDGKTLPRSFGRKHEYAPLHLVIAWASTQGLVLGQRCVRDKSNEITAILALPDQLVLQGSIVTLDTLGHHRSYPGKLPRSMQQILLVSCRRGTRRSKCRPAIHLQLVTQSAYNVL